MSPRTKRRLLRHHLPLALCSAAALLGVYAAVDSTDAMFRWSMATGYVGLTALGATLVSGPLNLLGGRPNPVSSDLRRDVGIWAGVLSVAHFLVGWQVHMKHRYLYWLRETKGTGELVIRTDLFGWANHTGLVAVLIAVLLLALSNDLSLRRLGTTAWKRLQRWNYALFALVIAHGAAYQVVEKRQIAFVALFVLLSIATLVVQLAGVRARKAGARSG